MRRDPMEQYRTDLEAYARSEGLSRTASRAYAQLAVWSAHYGEPAPEIVSGRRSQRRKRELQQEWDRYGSRGPNRLRVRPANDSAHDTGEGFDVQRTRSLPWWISWAPLAGLRAGAAFGDDIHFDTRTGR